MINKLNPRFFIFAIFVLMCILIMCITSCGVLKNHYLQKYCKESDSVSVSDKTTIEFDTLKVYYPVQGETIYLDNPCKSLCDSLGNLKPIKITKTKHGITSTVSTIGNVLKFDCKEDSLMYVIETQKRVIDTFEKDTKVVLKDCELSHLKGWHYFLMWSGGIALLFLFIKYIGKAIWQYIKLYLPFLK